MKGFEAIQFVHFFQAHWWVLALIVVVFASLWLFDVMSKDKQAWFDADAMYSLAFKDSVALLLVGLSVGCFAYGVFAVVVFWTY